MLGRYFGSGAGGFPKDEIVSVIECFEADGGVNDRFDRLI